MEPRARRGDFAALVATLSGLLADQLGPDALHSLVPYWNSLALLAFFAVVVQLLATLKDTMDEQRQRADIEHEVSSGCAS